jgi:DNA-binding IclR family transcriptional regulator
MRLGQKAPLYTTSYGKALLAYLPVDMQEDYLQRIDLVAMTPKTIRSIAELRRQLRTIRRDGIAYSFEEHVAGIVGTACPVLGPNGNVAGAISIASAAIRYDRPRAAQIAQAIHHAVEILCRQLRHLATDEAIEPSARSAIGSARDGGRQSLPARRHSAVEGHPRRLR